ncbi:MAG: NnrS family protein [Alphaproteobacteria bacterium]|nr:NnrS family protein [Alphaproteobacteria bacterium]
MKNVHLFSIGFRPFFLLAGVQAVFSIVAWGLMYAGVLKLSSVWENPVLWHGHEMVFGFAMAVIAGFLLTAAANWTGRAPLQSWPLAFLAGLWIAGRLCMAMSILTPMQTAIVDSLFIPAVALSLAPMLIGAGKLKNMAFLVILSLFAVLNILMHLSVLGVIELSAETLLFTAVHIIIFLIAVIGGRVLPFFTQNGMTQRGRALEVKVYPYVNELSLVLLLATCIYGYLSAFNGAVFGVLALLASAVHFARLTQWQGHKTLSVPIVWILHLGYFWLVVGLFLEGLYALLGMGSFQAALHTLTIGAIGTMILGMMTRVCLGHTGRPITSLKSMVLAYVLLQGAVISRLLGEMWLVTFYTESILLSGILWATGFGLFILVYFPILISKRPDGK